MSSKLKYRREALIQEMEFETSRSGGKGGQHANKTESRVTAVFSVIDSQTFNEREKERICGKLHSRLNNGVLRISAEDSRSQHTNKQIAIDRLIELLEKALKIQKKRKRKKISKAQKEARLKAKKKQKEKKERRKPPKKGGY